MDEEFSGCICCMDTIDLFNLFTVYSENVETYAKMLESCFNIKVTSDLKHICKVCARKLEEAAAFKEQTAKSVAMLQSVKDEEYLDESILEEAECILPRKLKLRKVVQIVRKPGSESVNENEDNNFDDMDDEYEVQALDETICIYCELTLPTAQQMQEHVRSAHGIEPRTGFRLRECSLCGATLGGSADDHFSRCHGVNSEVEARQFPCHFCANVYNSRKACYTHLRMKHGLKLSNDQTPKYTPRERKKCHICDKDFSQKQILNKHLWKAHGFEVEKRKAFVCPLCSERVSYGTHFSEHLLHEHGVHEQVEKLEFQNMDDFMLYKSAIQEESKYRFRKTTASKQTIEGVRSHYMCSQSGVYVYQGKGKRPTPERQIYKTGKACPAHMIVTEAMDRVLVTFHKTHVGHGACPYYEPREPKKPKPCVDSLARDENDLKLKPEHRQETDVEDTLWICDACGKEFVDCEKFRDHVIAHGLNLFPCQNCDNVFQNIDAWTRHLRIEHNVGAVF